MIEPLGCSLYQLEEMAMHLEDLPPNSSRVKEYLNGSLQGNDWEPEEMSIGSGEVMDHFDRQQWLKTRDIRQHR